MGAWTVTPADPPASLRHPRREANLLWYGSSRLLTARTEAGTVGAIRFAVRTDRSDQGLITDLVAEAPFRDQGLANDLIGSAERALEAADVKRIEAVVVDGLSLSLPFQARGYQPFRKTVVLQWDLGAWQPRPAPSDFQVEVVDHIDLEEIANFIFGSYQPYWQWWEETGEEAAIGRAEYPVEEPTGTLAKQRAANWERVVAALAKFNTDRPQRFVIARQGGNIIGLCDAKADPEESFEWGVLASRQAGGGKIGSALLAPALAWLKGQGLTTAQVTTTSGLDDYDPTVYLYVLVGGAQIRGEFLVLKKQAW